MELIIVLYVITSVISYGGTFAYFQEGNPLSAEESYRKDMGVSILFSLIPFVGFIVSLFITGFYEKGFKFK